MGSMIRLRGVDRRGLRDGYRPTGGASTPDPLLVVDRLTSASVTPNFFGSTAYKLATAYAGNAIRVRKGTGGGATFSNIGFAGSYVDIAALTTFAAGASCYLHTVYAQDGSGRDFTQATEANQPKIYDSVAGPCLLGTLLAPEFTGTTYLARTDSCGVSGAVACTLFSHGSYANAVSAVGTSVQCGPLTSNARLEQGISNAVPGFSNLLASANNRIFTKQDFWDEPCGYVTTIAAGGQIGASTYRQQSYTDAWDLAQAQVNGGTNTCTFGTTASGIGGRSNGTLGAIGSFHTWGIMGSVAITSGAALTALDNFAAAACVSAYEGSILFGGQSNASLLLPQNAPEVARMQWRRASQGGQALSYFLKNAGTGMYEEMLDEITKTPAGSRIFQCWLHGEANCTVALAANYLTDLTQLAADLAADSGRSDIFWIVFDLHDDGVYNIVGYTSGAKATIRAALASFVTNRGASLSVLVDATALAGGLDPAEAPWPTHYDATMNTAAMTEIAAQVNAHP